MVEDPSFYDDFSRFFPDVNQDGNCLHGGKEGFHKKHWQLGTLPDGVRLSLKSPDGDMGFPGNCNVQSLNLAVLHLWA